MNRQTIVCEIDEVLADIGQPDCKMINPVLVQDDGLFCEFLDPLSDQKEMFISSDKILTLVDPNQETLEKYFETIQ